MRPIHARLAGTLLAVSVGCALPRPADAQTLPPLRTTTDATTDGIPLVSSPAGDRDGLPTLPVSPTPKSAKPTARQTALADKKKRARSLTPLVAYPTASRSKGSPQFDTVVVPPPTVAALPEPQRRKIRPDDKPFDPIGYTIGSLRVTPYIESDIGYDSNPNRVNAGKGSAFGRIEGGGTIASDWATNSLTANLRGGYNDYFSLPSANRPDGAGTVDLRLDVLRDTTIDAEGRFALTTQTTTSPGVARGASSQPLVQTYGGTVGGTQRFGRLSFNLRGSVDRTSYDDAEFGSTRVSLAGQDFDTYGLRGRVSYEVTPGLSPFVEVFGDTRRYDQRIDSTGYARDSNGVGAQLGTTFEFTRTLTGQIAAGYLSRDYEDARFKSLATPTLDAALIWTATPLTTVNLRGTSTIVETTAAGSPGADQRQVTLGVSHQLLRNLVLSANLGYLNTDYKGIAVTEDTYSAGVRADYAITRSIVVRASFTHERLKSTTPGSDYTANVFLLGLRLQH